MPNLLPTLAQLPPQYLGSLLPLPLPPGFPLAFCGYLLDTPDVCAIPASSTIAIPQGLSCFFLFHNVSQATLGLLPTGAIGTLTFPLSTTTLFSSMVSVQSSQVGSMLLTLCTLLSTTSFRKGTVFSS